MSELAVAPDDVRTAFAASKRYFASPAQELVYYLNYARWNDAAGRRETWIETVDRAVDFLRELSQYRLAPEVYGELREGILGMRAMPAMRLLAMAGPAARRDGATCFNCSAVGVHCLDAFVDAMMLSMAGCGVGFSVEHRFIDRLPMVRPQRGRAVRGMMVEDSAPGWGDALRVGLETWCDGGDVTFDLSLIRPAGAPLKTKGGQASGPGPLRDLLSNIRARILSRQGGYLTSLDAHDIMCWVGQAAVSGGVRRSAMLSLFDADDTLMLTAKSPGFDREHSQRWNANNSAVWDDDLSEEQFREHFMQMVRSGNGEPGTYNRAVANRMRPSRRQEYPWLTNPCFRAGTLVQTDQGHFPIEDLVGKTVRIWNGDGWQEIDNFRVTARYQPMLKIVLHDGSEVAATPYHSFILEDGSRIDARDIVAGMRLMISDAPESHGDYEEAGAYLKGFLLADGTASGDRAILQLYEPKYGCQDRLIASASEVEAGAAYRATTVMVPGFRPNGDGRMVMTGLTIRKEALLSWATTYKERLPREVFAWSQRSKCELLAGLFDGDGTASDTRNGYLYQLASIHRAFLLDIQALLKTLGVRAHLSLMRAAGATDFNDGYGAYATQDCWRLTLPQAASVRFAQQVRCTRLVSFADKRVAYRIKPKFNRVVSVTEDGIDDEVYCCTVEGSHSFALTQGIQVGQCAEIHLRDMQTCNLSIAVARPDDTIETLAAKVKLASILGTIQSMNSHFPYLRPGWKENQEEERLLGVDITGQFDAPIARDPYVLRQMREVAIGTNVEYARLLGINRSAAVTCVKPSGNSAQLLDVASGVHPRYAPYYIRRYRIGASSPLYGVLRDAGMELTPENGQDAATATTWVAAFPMKAPDGAITRNDLTAVEHCDYWLMVRKNYTEHKVSATIYYGPDEVEPLMDWLWEHRDEVDGMTFLPRHDIKLDQLPYEEIDRETYERMQAALPEIDFSRMTAYEKMDQTTASQEGACAAGACETI